MMRRATMIRQPDALPGGHEVGWSQSDGGAETTPAPPEVVPDALKNKAIQGGALAIATQATTFGLRTASLVVLARLLLPEDFGLVAMVTAVTGFLRLFRDAGLSLVTVQRSTLSVEQSSTLFWINLATGGLLVSLCIAIAPAAVAFYQEPRLLWLTAVLSGSFLLDAAGAQHYALLRRQMRFRTLVVIDIVSLVMSLGVGIAMAASGWQYWALVATAVIGPGVTTAGSWIATGWIPGKPRRVTGLRSMLRFGGTMTGNNVVTYLASNAEKVLLGRFWGPGALGLYGRAYQLISMPTDQLNMTVGWAVAFPILSRLQVDQPRLMRVFLRMYSLVLSVTIPVTIGFVLFAEDLILVLLGPRWDAAAVLLRLLGPAVLAFELINPFTWLLVATGQVERHLKMSLVMAPLIIAAYVVGLQYGPTGVAFGYSAMMSLLVVPMIAWAKKGTLISSWDVVVAASRPALAGVFATAVCGVLLSMFGELFSTPIPRLIVEFTVFLGSYAWFLLVVLRQRAVYADLCRSLLHGWA